MMLNISNEKELAEVAGGHVNSDSGQLKKNGWGAGMTLKAFHAHSWSVHLCALHLGLH